MLNRTELANGNIRFESYNSPTLCPFVGEVYEVPMSASGWAVARYEVVSVSDIGNGKVAAEAKRIK